MKPMVIAHRGYCSLFPENTMESIEAALYKCNLVEIDVQLTKDHQIVIFHDRYLSHITNIEQLEKFKQRKRVASYDYLYEQDRDDWWLVDFTLQELKELSVRQVFPERPQLRQLQFKIPTLEDAIREVLVIKDERLRQNRCGFLIEIKSLWEGKYDEWDDLLIAKMVEVLARTGLDNDDKCQQKRLPVVLQSFNHGILLTLANTDLDLPVVSLFDQMETIDAEFLKVRAIRNQVGIGITEAHANDDIRQLCTRSNLQMLYWTLRDDQPDKIPFRVGTYREAYLHLIKLGINGFITEYPEKCEEYINEVYRVS